MTVSTTDSQIDYSSGGPSFPIPFKFLRDEDIRPVLTMADGSQVTLVQNVQFTITGAGSETGGTLTSAYAQAALATAGTLLRISRVMDPTQETDLRNQGRYFAETHEKVFDKLTMLVQQSLTGVANALSLNSLKNRWDFRGLRGVNAGNPIDPQDVTTKSYVDSSNAAQDTRIDSLSAGLPGTNYAFPWSTTTTTGTKTLTPGFEFASAVLYINGIAQTYGKAFAVAGNQIVLAEAIPAGTEVYAILGQNVVPSDYVTKPELAAGSGASLISYLAPSSTYLRGLDQKLSDWVDPRDYGAVSGSNGDAGPAIRAAAEVARSKGVGLRMSGSYRIYTTSTLRQIPVDFQSCQFTVYGDQIGFILGGSSNLGWAPAQSIGTCLRSGGLRDVPTIRIAGSKGIFIEIGRTTHLQFYASTTLNTDGSIAYSQFKGGQIDKLSIDTDPANAGGDTSGGIGSSVQWVNENDFWISRCFEFYMGGSYRHNHNRFHGLTLENEATINIQAGNKNRFYNLRLEAGPTTIIFGTETANNRLMNSWDPGNDDTPSAIVSGSIVDLGVANVVYDDFGECRNTSCVASASISDPLVSQRVGELNSRQPHLQRVGGSGGNQPMCYSDMLPIEANLFFYFLYAGAEPGDTALYRPVLEFYDKNLVPISAQAAWITGNGITSVSGNVISTSAGQPFSYATVLQQAIDAGAMFMRVAARVSSSQTANALARRIQIFASYAHGSNYQSAAFQQRYLKTVVSAAPTAGFVPVGYEVTLASGASFYVCTFAFESISTAAAASGSTTITLAAATGVAVGDRVGVNLDNRDTHWTTVNAISGTTLTLTSAIPSASASGSRVVFNRQITK